MFVVKSIRTAECVACGKQVECFDVKCPPQRPGGRLRLPDFSRQAKIASVANAGSSAHRAPTTGAAARANTGAES